MPVSASYSHGIFGSLTARLVPAHAIPRQTHRSQGRVGFSSASRSERRTHWSQGRTRQQEMAIGEIGTGCSSHRVRVPGKQTGEWRERESCAVRQGATPSAASPRGTAWQYQASGLSLLSEGRSVLEPRPRRLFRRLRRSRRRAAEALSTLQPQDEDCEAGEPLRW